MKWRVVFRPEVEQDVAEAARWYESKQAGLGAEFVEEVFKSGTRLEKILYSTPDGIRAKVSAGVILKDFLTASFTKLSKQGKP
jgi:hypothetical protein